jgi:hypothetical protein
VHKNPAKGHDFARACLFELARQLQPVVADAIASKHLSSNRGEPSASRQLAIHRGCRLIPDVNHQS